MTTMKKLFALLFALALTLGVLFTVSKDVLVNVADAKRAATSPNASPTPPPIVSISICTAKDSGGLLPGSCGPAYDTHQAVLGPSPAGISINDYVHGGVSDEHQSVFSPGKLNGNSDYLFFVASRTKLNDDTGLLVLSGMAGKEPDTNGQWTLNFASGYGYYPAASPCARPAASPSSSIAPYAPVFLSPSGSGCPTVNDGQPSPDPAHQDQTFDLNYAAPGSIVFDPTSGGGNLLMVYEGTNTCFGTTGGSRSNGFYSTVGVATSLDYGRHWPTYHDSSSFAFVPLPCQNATAGPNPWGTATPNAAVGPGKVYEGNDTQSTPPANYGRYAVLSPSVSISTAMQLGQPLPGDGSIGDAEMSAFLDDVNGNPSPYLYVIYNDNLGGGKLKDDNEIGGMSIARAQLSGAAQLSFEKWYQPGPTPGSTPEPGSWVPKSGIGGLDTPIFASAGLGHNCLAATQKRFGGSLSYVEATHQYLLTFVCTSPGDPASCKPDDALCMQDTTVSPTGGAWFYATSYDPSDPTQWNSPDSQGNPQPQEIKGSWSPFDTATCGSNSFKGWYPTFMSLANNPGHLSTSGYVFYLYGCQTGDANRTYSSRAFTITTTDTTPPVTTAAVTGPAGLNGWYTGPTTVSFTATDDLSGVATTQYSLDGGHTWTTGTSISLTTGGIYHILYQSIDVDKNAETPKSITVNLDSRGPAITESASPSTIFNDARVVDVAISGKITDDLSGVDPATARFAVHDEYGRVQPSGPVTIAADGTYSFSVALRTVVRANDPDGRLYTIHVSAADNAGNRRAAETFVTVKRLRTPPCRKNCI
jgi:hypothetical protein